MKRNKSLLFMTRQMAFQFILCFAILLIAVTFSIIRIRDTSVIRKQYSTVSIRFQSGGITGNFLSAALQNVKKKGSGELPEITAWSQRKSVQIRNETLDRKTAVRMETAFGDVTLINPMTLVHGNYLYPEDFPGCIIDSSTAYQLYGTENAVGNTVTCQKKVYYIRGVVKTSCPLMIVEGNGEQIKYSNLEFVYQDGEQAQRLAEEFLSQNGFPRKFVAIDGYFYGRVLHAVSALPLWLLLLVLGMLYTEYLRKKIRVWKSCQLVLYGMAGVLLILGYGILLYQFTGNPLYFPQKLIPTKFSDFDFWTGQYKLIRSQLHQMRYLVPNPKDVRLEEEISGFGLNLLIMLILYLALIKQMIILFEYKEKE